MNEEYRCQLSQSDKENILQNKEKQILNILLEGNTTFGMAKNIIQRVEAKLFSNGNTYLTRTQLENVFPQLIVINNY